MKYNQIKYGDVYKVKSGNRVFVKLYGAVCEADKVILAVQVPPYKTSTWGWLYIITPDGKKYSISKKYFMENFEVV